MLCICFECKKWLDCDYYHQQIKPLVSSASSELCNTNLYVILDSVTSAYQCDNFVEKES